MHLIMGDVSGRGPDEAALGANLRISWHALTLAGTSGGLVLPTLQQMIERERQASRAFATVCSLEIQPAERRLCLRRAGHPAPVLIDGGSVTSLPLQGGGPPIGMFGGVTWPDSVVQLPPAWSILLYTDGVIEGRGGDRRLLGEEGLRRLIADHVAADPQWRREPQALLAHVVSSIRELHGAELADDVAMLLVGNR